MSVTFSAVNANQKRTYTSSTGETWEIPTRVFTDEDEGYDGAFFLNLANDNAAAFLALLGNAVKHAFDPYCGEMEIAIARRAIMAVRATFESAVQQHVRETQVEYAAPRVNGDGAVELRPLRRYEKGIDASYFDRRLVKFANLVEEAAKRGATHITWG